MQAELFRGARDTVPRTILKIAFDQRHGAKQPNEHSVHHQRLHARRGQRMQFGERRRETARGYRVRERKSGRLCFGLIYFNHVMRFDPASCAKRRQFAQLPVQSPDIAVRKGRKPINGGGRDGSLLLLGPRIHPLFQSRIVQTRKCKHVFLRLQQAAERVRGGARLRRCALRAQLSFRRARRHCPLPVSFFPKYDDIALLPRKNGLRGQKCSHGISCLFLPARQ